MNHKKKKPYKKWSLILLPILVIAAGAVWLYMNDWNVGNITKTTTESGVQQTETAPTEEPKQDKAEELEEQPADEKATEEKPAAEDAKDARIYDEKVKLPKEPTIVDGVLVANKQHPLPSDYEPGESKEARAAFESMRADALKQDIDLIAFSTFRGFDRQKELYDGYVAKDGQAEADRYSARPGYSEHQTGLAFDIGESAMEEHWASASFGDTTGGKWLAKNAHNYGFILRYPKGKENITGYMHESWHYRYVGKKVAADVYAKSITLEEYLGI
ncbi:M15 family metallopeptidase [Planococcus sp. YIM B11945]|uniref:M15 family metallopeptidase n=1 Tax=Planococcus sp. YIM B11945 TaxID=3435410 RepID=UPI003D7E9AFA